MWQALAFQEYLHEGVDVAITAGSCSSMVNALLN